jgi:hypothetical protein
MALIMGILVNIFSLVLGILLIVFARTIADTTYIQGPLLINIFIFIERYLLKKKVSINKRQKVRLDCTHFRGGLESLA